MDYPLAVVKAADGTVYVADRNLPGIWQIQNGQLSLYFKGSKKFRTPLNAVRCLAIDHQGRLLAGDSSTREIYRFERPGEPIPLTKGYVGIPMAMAVSKDGSIVVSDLEIQRLMRVPADGGEPTEIVEIAAVRGLAVDADDRIWAVAHNEDTIVRFSPDGKQREVLLKGRPFEFSHHLVLSPAGDAFVADGYAKTIWKLAAGATDAKPIFAGLPLKNPVGLTADGENLLVADPHTKTIYRLSASGEIESFYPAQP